MTQPDRARGSIPPLLRDDQIRRTSWRGPNQSGESVGRSMRQRRNFRLPWWKDKNASSPQNSKSLVPDDRESNTKSQEFEIIISGYLFVEQEYVAPPYRLRVEQQQLLINDHKLMLPTLPPAEGDELGMNAAMRWAGQLTRGLQRGSVIIVSNDEAEPNISFLPRFENGYPFLQYLAGEGTNHLDTIRDKSPAAAWVASYNPPAELVARAQEEVEQIEQARAHIHSGNTPTDIGYWAYPLTAGGMFLVAVAIGQLCVSRSLLTGSDGRVSPDALRSAERCILFIVGLSLLDLVCTVLALRANAMHELNPLASQFLSHPLALIGFKLTVTLLGAALLYCLRSHFPARRAAWWLCLVCTLVMVRWVTFQSLFVT